MNPLIIIMMNIVSYYYLLYIKMCLYYILSITMYKNNEEL